MSDLIDRDAVMLRVREFIGNPTYDETMLVNDLNALPSAEPERKWIPVTERLPKPWQEVLTTYEYRARQYVQTAEYTGHTDDNGHPLFCSYTDEYAPDHYDFIYEAWMPLPEPWRGEQ